MFTSSSAIATIAAGAVIIDVFHNHVTVESITFSFLVGLLIILLSKKNYNLYGVLLFFSVIRMDLVEMARKIEGYKFLYSHQEQALRHIDNGKGVVLVAPTAAGKTVVAKGALLRALLNGKKAIYTSPLVALSSEKYTEFKSFFSAAEKMGILQRRPGIAFVTGSIQRMTGSEKVRDADVLVTSFEKLDSLLTRGDFTEFIKNTETIVIDEVHVLYDQKRGATVEKFMALIRHLNPDIKVVALSATIGNPGMIAKWLDAELVVSNFRPVELERMVFAYKDNLLINLDRQEYSTVAQKYKLPVKFIEELLGSGKQGLIFVSSRKISETLAKNLSTITEKYLTDEDKQAISRAIGKIPSDPVSKRVIQYLKKGISFHHSGLPSSTRGIIEKLFRERHLKLLTATPGLSAGVNLPAAFVVVRDIYRYNGKKSTLLTSFEVQQMLGRAGRPQFENTGITIIVADITPHIGPVVKRYYYSPAEGIESPLFRDLASSNSMLETKMAHLILQYAKIAGAHDVERLAEKTLAYTQAREWGERPIGMVDDVEISGPEDVIYLFRELKHDLQESGFLDGDEITDNGEVALKAYVSPATVKYFAKRLHEDMTVEEFIHVVLKSPECKKNCNLNFAPDIDLDEVFDFSAQVNLDPFSNMDTILTMKLVMDWMNGADEEDIYEKYGIMPGDFGAFITSLNWIAWAALEYASLKMMDIGISPSILTRIEYGIPEEAVELVKLPMIGRKRAAILIKNGIHTKEEFARTDAAKLSEILGLRVETIEKIKNSIIS